MEKWYYDSNTLDKLESYREIINKNNPHQSLISHLSVGEAYANSILKGEAAAETFLELFSKMRQSKFIEIVKNDGSDGLFDDIRDTFKRLSVTDALHLATAIENGCCILRTGDIDLYGLDEDDNKNKLKILSKQYGLARFAITKVN